MSTQYTASWCLFHALCKYCARRGTFKSISSGSLWLFVPRINRQEEYCLSLTQILTSRYKSRVDDRMKIERTSNMVNMLGEIARNNNIVLQWKINKIASWMSLKSSVQMIIPESSVQYWNLLFTPPPAAKHAFHRSSDQWIDCGNWFWGFSFILQKWTAPSSSRCAFCEWRRRWITFFDTSYSEREYFPGSISIQFLLSMGPILGEEPASSLLCGFAFAFDRHAKSFCAESGRSDRASFLATELQGSWLP